MVVSRVIDSAKLQVHEDKLKNGVYTHICLMLDKTLDGNTGNFFVTAYNSDKEYYFLEAVFSEGHARSSLAEQAKEHNLIDDGLVVYENFDPIDRIKQMTSEDNNRGHNLEYYHPKIHKIEQLDSNVLEHLKEVEKSFGVERDLKSGSMLVPDQEKLDGIMNMRLTGLETILSSGGTDDLLAFEMVYLFGGEDDERCISDIECSVKDPIEREDAVDRILAISSLVHVIDRFHDIRKNPKTYKSGVEYRNISDPPEDGRKFNVRSYEGIDTSVSEDLARLSKNLEKKVDSASGLEERVLSLRKKLVGNLIDNYRNLQKELFFPEKEAAKTKEAGVEMGV